MRILLVNDDGYLSEGILTLERVLKEKGHEICVAAPHTQQSAKSHAMTVHGTMIVHRHDEYHYSLEGTPADCIIYSLRSSYLPFKPDVIVSGINHGYNLSSDTIYSGTCGAARQGAKYSIPSIAISEEKDERGEYDFVSPSVYLERNLSYFASILKGSDSFLNLNFPPHWNGRVKKAALGSIDYFDNYFLSDDGKKMALTFESMSSSFTPRDNSEYEADRLLAEEGYASATIIRIEPEYDRELMLKLSL